MSTDPPLASSPRASQEQESGGDVVCRTWDAGLASRSPLFWPIAGALDALVATMVRAGSGGATSDSAGSDGAAGEPAFPQPEAIDAALGARAGIRFERQRPVSRRRRGPRDPGIDV